MQNQDARIIDYGKTLLAHESKSGMSFLSPHKWSQSLLDKMMENESFRVASLRFTDVAPTLRNDSDFMDHMSAYFANVGGLDKILAGGIPGSKLLGKVIAPVMRKNIKGMAENFIAGETIEDGLKTFQKLHKDNLACSIDLLGEAVISKKEAEDFVKAYHHAIKVMGDSAKTWPAPTYPEADAYGPILRANVSVKLSALYEHLDIAAHDRSVDALSERFAALLDTAMTHGCYIHIDTEHFQLVPLTLDVFKRVLMDDKYKNWPHVGIVVQAYLRDSESLLDDLTAFAAKRGTPFSIRLVKGAYWDFEQAHAEQKNWPCPVFDHKEETDINYEKLTKKLIHSFPTVRPCIGSHNARSIAVALAAIDEAGLSKGDVEFQALFGMADNFRDGVKAMGYRVRQYCPVGEFIPGMSYLVRRLLENTANQSFLRMRARNEAPADLLLAEPIAPAQAAETTQKPFVNRAEYDFSQDDLRQKAQTALDHWHPRMPMDVRPVVDGTTLNPNKPFVKSCPWDTQTPASQVYFATAKDADKAVEVAYQNRDSWRELGFNARADILDRAADLMEDKWDELFALQVIEAGKDWLHADADIAEAIDFLRYYAWQARTLEDRMQPLSVWGERNTTVYEPRGVAAVIAPWNFPLAISTGMTAAALVAGNPVVYKPAEQTSANGQSMYNIFRQAGVPEGVLHFLPGDGAEVGATLVEHPKVAMIAFTGSREVGLNILEAAGTVRKGQSDVKKCVIEMGGKNAIIIDSDADLDEAVPGVVHSAFGFQGQKCSACSRAIVVGSAYEPFLGRIKEMVDGLRVGPSNNPMYDVGAVIDEDAQAKINSYIAIGKKDGHLLAQAPAPKEQGHFVPPAVFTDLKEGSKLTTEEVFGPILAVYKANTVDEAVTMAMDSDYALTGGLYSRNPDTITKVQKTFRVGNLYINRGSTGALVGRQPFGGAKMSGTGTKAGGPDYLLHFVEPRVVTENTMRRGYAPKEDA